MTEAAEAPQNRRFSIAQLGLLVAWVALVIDAWGPIRDNSFLWHVRAGTLQADTGSVLTEDPFSFTMNGEPWLTQSWLVELLYGWLEGRSGLGFVPLMILVTSTLAFVCVGLAAYRRSQSYPATGFVLILTTLALISFLVPRPVLFSYLLMALVVLAWERGGARWTIPLLFWIWAAVHASFLVGLGYVGLTILMRRQWREIPTAVMSGVAILGTAHGLSVVGFLVDFNASRDALQYLSEWRQPELLDPVFIPFLGSLVFIVIGAFRQLVRPRHLWIIVPFTALAFTSVRAIPMAFLALVPLTALSLSKIEIGTRAGLRPHLALVFAIVILGLPFLLIGRSELLDERFPVEAATALDDVPTFHDDVTGGYLIWADGPERLVYLDDRAELYGGRLAEYVAIRDGDAAWQPVFERDGIEQALLPAGEDLVDDLSASGWETTYEDDHFVVLMP